MSELFIATEAKLFCLFIAVFILIFKSKTSIDISKNTQLIYFALSLGILSTIVSRFIVNDVLNIILFAFCGICYAVSSFFLLGAKKPLISAVCSIVFGCLTFYSLYIGINAATYILTAFGILTLVFGQFKLITTDNLTGLYNLYARKLEIEEQEREYKRDHSDSFYVFSCDLDRFKSINDTWGHPEGDRALGLVSKALTKVADKFGAKVFRVGGDEFQIIADTSDEKEADKIEKSLQAEFEQIKFRADFDIEISVGKVLYNGVDEVDKLLKEADDKLYDEKKRRKKEKDRK